MMTGLPAAAFAVHRLRIRNAEGTGPVLRKEDAERLRLELEWSDQFQGPRESWVFVRQVTARGLRSRLARDIVYAVHQEMTSGNSDNVVRFSDLSELLAALLADLLTGQAAGRWYWQRWAYLFGLPTPSALTQLLTEYIDYFPSVCARLAHRRSLAQLWRKLDHTGAYRLAAESARNYGFKLPPTDRFEAALTAPPETPENFPTPMPAGVRQRWTPVLEKLSPSDPRLHLALVLIAGEIAPIMMQQHPLGTMTQLMRTLHPAWVNARTTPPRETVATNFSRPRSELLVPHGASPLWPRPLPAKSVTTQTEERSAAEAGFHATATTNEPPASLVDDPGNRTDTYDRSNPLSGAPPAVSAFPEIASEQSLPALPASANVERPRTAVDGKTLQAGTSPLQLIETKDSAFTTFATRQGGLLYLLNFLNRSEAHKLLASSWEKLPNGWAWLYRLGQELSLEETDPIVAFIAQRLGLDRAEELSQLPSLPARKLLLTLAQHWYGGDGLWHPRLLHVNAVIRTSPSHIDMYASLDAVRLSVRLASLDINPGWLPWLGVVVNFHYD